MSESFVCTDPCKRCGCHVAHTFKCNCGEVHGDVCDNCGLKRGPDVPEKYLKLGELDARCERGAVMHEHPYEERAARLDAWHRRLDAMTDAELLAYFEQSEMSEASKEDMRRMLAEGRRRPYSRASEPLRS